MNMPFSKNQILIIAVVIVAIVCFYMKGKSDKGDLVYFFSPKCPHCRDFMPVWDSLSVPVNKKKVDCSLQACQGIEALPTLMMNGEEFKGERTKENIETFVNNNLKKSSK